jgi:hypothetical protein
LCRSPTPTRRRVHQCQGGSAARRSSDSSLGRWRGRGGGGCQGSVQGAGLRFGRRWCRGDHTVSAPREPRTEPRGTPA